MNIFFAIFTPEQDFFGFLQLMRDEGVAKILTQPKVVTLSGRPASFLSGGKVPIQAAAGFGVSTIQFERVGTSVDVLPVVLGNGRIRLEVAPQVSRRNDALGAQGNPGFDTQAVRTVVEIEPGHTLAIGGLIDQSVNGLTRKVPVLGDLPFIGVAFSRKFYEEIESELLVLVTPHLVDPMSCDQLPKLLPGQESRSPDDFELFLEGILEAPRGPREVCPNEHYVPAYKNGPTAAVFPCAPGQYGGHGQYGVNGAWGNGAGCCPPTGVATPAVAVPFAVRRPTTLPPVNAVPEAQPLVPANVQAPVVVPVHLQEAQPAEPAATKETAPVSPEPAAVEPAKEAETEAAPKKAAPAKSEEAETPKADTKAESAGSEGSDMSK
jgi:pilus assembly protein CpaC